MREYIDSRDVANTVMMLATAFDGTITVVEGITDRRLYGKFTDRKDTVFLQAGQLELLRANKQVLKRFIL